MKKEDLEKVGLSEEQQAEVFRLNGLAIEQYKTDNSNLANTIQTLETEKSNLATDLKTANKTIEEFKTMDIDSVKATADDYKKKYEQAEEQRTKELNDMTINYTLDTALLKAGAKNTKAVKALLDVENLKGSQNLDTDIETAITGLKESDAYLFDESKGSNFMGGGNQLPPESDPNKMSYEEFAAAYGKGLIK